MVSKRLQISAGIVIIAVVWIFFLYEAVVGEFLTNGGIVILLCCTGMYFGARLLGLKFPKWSFILSQLRANPTY